MKITDRTITFGIDGGYRDYAMYVLESRAIPSVIDGLKPVTRKLLYAMLTEYSGRVKVADLGGISKHNFHHGEKSAVDAAIGMAQSWNNTAPLFEQHGNFGSRLVPASAGPRYIHVSLSKTFKKFFSDTEVAPLAFKSDNPEPAFYLPTIPWVLVNGIGGIAVGFKAEILPRALADVINATKAYLKAPEAFLAANALIPPTFPSFTGKTTAKGLSQWVTQGIVKFVGKNTYSITELPVGYDRETYVTLLNELIDKELIKDYEDECSKLGFGFRVKVTVAQKAVIDNDPIKYFKLEKTHTEILTTMGINGKLKIFQSVAELVGYFCDYRLTKFGDKIEYDKAEVRHSIAVMIDKRRFIQDVVDDKLVFKNTTKADMLAYIETHITPHEYGQGFIRIPLYECTQDQISKLDADIIDLKASLVGMGTLTPEKLYATRLNALKV